MVDTEINQLRSKLVEKTLGDWKNAPKDARSCFDHFIATVARLIGGECAPQEVMASALAIWEIMSSAEYSRALEYCKNERFTAHYKAAKVQPVREAVESKVGFVDSTNFDLVVESYCTLQQWQGERVAPPPPPRHSQASSETSRTKTVGKALPLPVSLEDAIAATCGCPANIAAEILHRHHYTDHTSIALSAISAGLSDKGKISRISTKEQVAQVESEVFGVKGRVKDSLAGALWLSRWCSKVNPEMDQEVVPTTVASLLLSSKSDDEIASELFDLMGELVFECIAELLQLRDSFRSNINKEIDVLREAEVAAVGVGGTAMPSYGTAVTVKSQSAKILEKKERKAERKVRDQTAGERGSGQGIINNIDWLSVNGLSALIELEEEREADKLRIRLGDGTEIRIGDGGGNRVGLPKGTKRQSFKGYEEVTVPATQPSAPPPGEERVLIEQLPDWAQLAFAGYTALNRIQSKIFSTAFYSNENVLVCAPTGAGKTNIAMIAILREIEKNMRDGIIQKTEFKVVYVAPMKALAGEVTASFSKRLSPLGLVVRELTGDMQLSKKELAETQMIVTTPEKWDVITRKGGEVGVAATVKLLIIDEVHLLNDERGPVIETLVARTSRLVEFSQSMIRILGLSATLPNPGDVASFLGVNLGTGLFHFDASYRPVPLETQFIGVSEKNILAQKSLMDDICYQKVVDSLKKGHQAMIFVHSRKDTGKTGRMLALKAQQHDERALFDCSEEPTFGFAAKDARKSRNRELSELFDSGIGLHHAGMLRSDRNLMERLFGTGMIKVLCCTATLAWGVNLPAHTVIIKGTQLYNPQKGGFTDLGMLDVQQIFGRAGRPQYQDSGLGVIITTHDKLAHYLSLLTHQVPIESQFVTGLVDHLNAEIVLGTVTNIREAVQWLGYTYLYVRMKQNPLVYGINWEELSMDRSLEGVRRRLIIEAARELERCKMSRFDEKSGNLYITELGRVASHYYISHGSITVYNDQLRQHMSEADLLSIICQSTEFENLALRDEELEELDALTRNACWVEARGGAENKHGKANILLQAYVSRARVDSFSLIADLNYVSQNAPRLARAILEICLRRGWSSATELCLTLSKCLERRLWPHMHPLWQFEGFLKTDLIHKLESKSLTMERLMDMNAGEIGAAIRHPAAGSQIASAVAAFPSIALEAQLHPITRSVVRVHLSLTATFKWLDSVHGGALRWLVWIEDSENEHIYHSETWTLTKKMSKEGNQRLAIIVPVFEPLPNQYYVRVVSDSWFGAETLLAVSFKGLILPHKYPPHTELLDLDPLPKTALADPVAESLYRFSHFNPIQTQAFHTLYHTDDSALLGAPTGSGKTISAELTMLRLFKAHPDKKVIYIAPLKALVKERMADWGSGFCRVLGKKLVELTGDKTPDMRSLLRADVIVCTPEKWDGISRSWRSRSYVQKVGLLIIDEIHLLGADRGPILEVIVSRMRYVAAQSGCLIRFVGLSTALANALDLGDWLGIPPSGLFNFKPSVRPVPLECHIQGYPGKFYCPRMATMNKPAYAAIQTHSPTKPVLIFVSSRRQTRLTALDLIAMAAADERPRTFLRGVHDDEELESLLVDVKDASLRHTLQFGIGLHHAGLDEGDRRLVEQLFTDGSIQVLVATSTLAWGINTPTHLVIVKGTEFYDAPTKRYVDFPITDILQMIGRAGRPQYDDHGVAVIMVYEPKKSFYKKFLYEPFPVESSLPGQLADHLNAEIVGGTIHTTQDAIDYLSWTFFIRRLRQNPSYYDLESTDEEVVAAFLCKIVCETLQQLSDSGCIAIISQGNEGGGDDTMQSRVLSTIPGQIGSFYYLQHQTIKIFTTTLKSGMEVPEVLRLLCSAAEFAEMPVRHNEDKLNAVLAGEVRWFNAELQQTADDPHTKTNLLLQAHLSRLQLPMSDYVTDTRSVLENTLRVLQALIDLAADRGWLDTTLSAMKLVQCIIQACWEDENPLKQLPGYHFDRHEGEVEAATPLVDCLMRPPSSLLPSIDTQHAEAAREVCSRLPVIVVEIIKQLELGDQALKEIEVSLTRMGGRSPDGWPPKPYTPWFPKSKEEGWWLIAGDGHANELHAVKRISFGKKTSTKLRVDASLTSVDIFLVSDSYLGLDRECLNVTLS